MQVEAGTRNCRKFHDSFFRAAIEKIFETEVDAFGYSTTTTLQICIFDNNLVPRASLERGRDPGNEVDLTMKNSSLTRFAVAVFSYVHFAAVLVLSCFLFPSHTKLIPG